MFVCHVGLQEVLVAELFVAQLAVSFNVEDLAPVARCETLLHLGPRHVHGGGGGWGGVAHAGKHEVWHIERSVGEKVGVARGCDSVPLQLLLGMLHQQLPAQHSQAALLRLVLDGRRLWRSRQVERRIALAGRCAAL